MDIAILAAAIGGLSIPSRSSYTAPGRRFRHDEGSWALVWQPGHQCQHAQIPCYQIDAYFDGTFTVSQMGGAMLVLHEGKARKGRKGINHTKNAAEIWLSQNRDRLPVLAAELEAKEVQR